MYISLLLYVLVKLPRECITERLYEGVVERLMWHEAQPNAMLGLETTPKYNIFRNAREYAVI